MGKHFTKLTTDEYDEMFVECLKDDLLIRILMLASARARRSNSKLHNLKENEFFLSEEEYSKFGLKKSQKGRIRRSITKALHLGFFDKNDSKTESRTGRKNATIYRFIQTEFMNWQNSVGNEIENEQRTDREQIENKQRGTKNDKSVKNDKNNIAARFTVQQKIDLILENFKKTQTVEDAWILYMKYRTLKRKPLSEGVQKERIEWLKKYPIQIALTMIKTSIEKQWTDIYELKNMPRGSPSTIDADRKRFQDEEKAKREKEAKERAEHERKMRDDPVYREKHELEKYQSDLKFIDFKLRQLGIDLSTEEGKKYRREKLIEKKVPEIYINKLL